MTTDTESRMACPTPDKEKYATLEAARLVLRNLGHTRGRDLEAYDTCFCGWIHLATKRERTGPEAQPLSVDDIIGLDSNAFNKVLRDEVCGLAHPDTAKALRNPRVVRMWRNGLRLFQKDLNIQKASKHGDRTPDTEMWLRRVDRVTMAVHNRMAEAKHIERQHIEQKEQENRAAIDSMMVTLPTDGALDLRALRMVAGELAIEKLKRAHSEEFQYRIAIEYKRLNLPLSKKMETALSTFEMPAQRTEDED